jgi:hypothetical protein
MTAITSSKLSSLSCYELTATNKRLLISESHDDSNRYTPCRGKPDQHVIHFLFLVRIWPSTIHILCGPHIATFHEVVNRIEQIHCPQEEGLPTQSTTRRLIDPWVRTQLLSKNSQWSSRERSSFCWQPATRLTGHINTSIQSVRSILARRGQPIGL